ncbi:hypothetical protein [Paenibacillus rigui]|uniref:Transposase-like Mu C-terminal domain-containing protein n=1 Tax=Paenibacillus rigui TaxID=554312 RepID=A0A229UUT2_9BACL|nr:hypothetical protein [Paenibacillus rigui]OXM87021.1 hypothetical protein CF651_07170 [Paenibacillus rigui]
MNPGILREGYGKVTARGILFKRNRYTCPRAIREQWFEKAALEKEWKVVIVYICELSEVIYVVDAEGEHEICYLINTKNNIYSDIKLQRYFQSIQKLKALRKEMNDSKKYRNRNKKKALTWKN